MQTRREALATGLAVAGVLGFAGCLDNDTGKPESKPDDEPESKPDDEPESKPDDETPDEDEYDLPSDYIDVREYGAVGDGETDDSGAIQDAIEAAEPGETVFLPETDASYLLSFDENAKYDDNAIELSSDSGLDDVTVLGETAAEGAQTLQVEAGSYNKATKSTILKITPDAVIDGFKLQNLTIDGARPSGDQPASLGGEEAIMGIIFANGASGEHDIVLEDILIQNCSVSGLRFAEPGVTCRRVTSRGHGRHGFNPVAAETTVDPGFVGQSIKAVDCDGTGIDVRRGTARLTHVFTENNRSGNKFKHQVERLEVENHHSVNEQDHGWRSNQSPSSVESAPSQQEIIFNEVFIENSADSGLRLSGSVTDIVCDLGNVEVRNTTLETSQRDEGVSILRDVEMTNTGSGELVVVETRNGVGVNVYKADVYVNTYYHSDNSMGGLSLAGDGSFSFNNEEKTDPGRNVYQTPARDEVGAFTEPISDQ